jgi:hypothetical protein
MTQGCNVGGTSTSRAENDRLRREALELRRDLERAEGEKAELRVKLAESQRSRTAAMDPAVLEAMPRITRIEFGILSGIDDATRSPRLVRFDLTPLDGRARFTQAVGTLTVEASVLPELTPGSTPQASPESGPLPGLMLGRKTLSPGELREAYRSGLTSPSYVVEIEPGQPVPETGELVLRVSFSDALTDQTHVATKTIRLDPARSTRSMK